MDKEILEKVRTTLMAQSVENKYKNLLCLSGWIIEKPRVITNEKTNQKSVSFVLYQFNRDASGVAYAKTYYAMSFVSQVVELLENMNKISFIICDGQLVVSSKSRKRYPQVYDLKVNGSLPYELVESEQKENE